MRTGTLWAVLLLFLVPAACRSTTELGSENISVTSGPAAVPESPPAAEGEAAGRPAIKTKDEILKEYERRMRIFLGAAVRTMEDIHRRFKEAMEAIPVPYKIQAVEEELAAFYKDREEAFEKQVMETAKRYEEEIRRAMETLEPRVWKIAFEVVGSEDMGTSYGSRTGIDEVDEIAEATLELLRFRSGLDTLQDEAGFYKYKRIRLDRLFKHDVEETGRFSVFLSDPMRHFFRKNEDVVAVTVTYQRKGLDPAVPLEFRQAVRNRVVRGGTTRFDSRFHWDETLGTPGGRLKLVNPGTDEVVVVVSRVFFPRINMDSPRFDAFLDFTAVRDYETAVVRSDTGEILDSVSWQLKWNISHFGCVAVENGAPPLADAEAIEIRRLMGGEGTVVPAGNPSAR